MTSIVVPNTSPFGAMSNQMAADAFKLNQEITRLAAAVAGAASGYGGTAGTEYEGGATQFGVVASATPGAQGAAFAYALNALASNWATFWSANLAYIEALDNGVTT